jgi:hypothetical protein
VYEFCDVCDVCDKYVAPSCRKGQFSAMQRHKTQTKHEICFVRFGVFERKKCVVFCSVRGPFVLRCAVDPLHTERLVASQTCAV